ncbi:hypothetical protein HOF65_02030 [bacterium]|jgi:hypothetical protein|nr:hypothetical protein [bacterium]MBT3852786.1 hypothetical protein [bacterium]
MCGENKVEEKLYCEYCGGDDSFEQVVVFEEGYLYKVSIDTKKKYKFLHRSCIKILNGVNLSNS